MSIETSTDPLEFTRFEHDGWEARGQGYEQHFTRLTAQSVGALLDAAGTENGLKLLDVCCGPGLISAAAVGRGAKVCGLDFAAEMIRIASAEVPGARFHEGDALALPFADDSFDSVVCGFGIIHLPDPAQALSEMHRVLKPGGQIAVSVWQAPGPGNGFGLLYGALKAHADLNVDLPHGPDFFQFSDVTVLGNALQHSGFRAPTTVEVEQFWEFDEATGLLTAFMEGAVRAPGIIMAQSETVKESITRALAAGMEAWRGDDGLYRLPMPALIGAAVK